MYRNITRTNDERHFISCFSAFIENKKAYKRDGSTTDDYECVLRYLTRDMCLTPETSISILDEDFICNWISKLDERSLSASSINHYLRVLRVFVNWCMEREYIKPLKVKMVKSQEQKIKFFTTDELQMLLKEPTCKDSFTTYRSWVITNFIIATGARASTVINITKDDIDLFNNEVTYRHLKNKKVAIIPLSESMVKILKSYINMWNIDSEYVFCDVCGNQLTVSALRQSFEKYCKKRNVNPRGPHSLRHSFAREFIKNGGNSMLLQKFLTHSTIAMSQHYVNLFADDLKESSMQYIPLDKFTQKDRISRLRQVLSSILNSFIRQGSYTLET